MANWRVVVDGWSDNGFCYRIEDVSDRGDYPFVRHVCCLHEDGDGLAPTPVGSPVEHHWPNAGSVEDLRGQLLAMLAACDKPVLKVRAETRLVEVG